MPVIAVDFGGTTIKIGLVEQGEILSTQVIPAISNNGILPRLEEVEAKIKSMLKEQNISPDACTGMGIAIPGIVDFHRKRVLSTNRKYDDAPKIDFPKWCRDSFNLNLMMDNDANCAILGETKYGCVTGATDAVAMIFGTGIGTAAIIGGKLLRGKHYQAGCLGGHMIIDRNGPVCSCGNRGCVEALTGTWALPELSKSRDGFSGSTLSRQPVIDYKTLMECVKSGDVFCRDLFADLLDCWGAGIVNLICAYDPEFVILSGGIMKDSEFVLPHLKQYVEKNAWVPWGKIEFRVSAQPNASVLLGLYDLCTDI